MRIRMLLGLIGTIVWLLAAVFILWPLRKELATMSPDAWGNFLAGFVAPLAFLWLILGYLQQGEDLRLQQAELRHQVEETAELVRQATAQAEAATAMLELERQQITAERQRERMRIQPAFQFVRGASTGVAAYKMDFRNVGGLARSLRLEADKDCQLHIEPADCLEKGGTGVITIGGIVGFPLRFWVRYVDELGNDGVASLECYEPGKFRSGPA